MGYDFIAYFMLFVPTDDMKVSGRNCWCVPARSRTWDSGKLGVVYFLFLEQTGLLEVEQCVADGSET